MTYEQMLEIAKNKSIGQSFDFLLGDIGVEEFYKNKPKSNNRYKADYTKIGKDVFYNKIVPKLSAIFCKDKEVKERFNIDSDYSVIIIALLSDYSNGTVIAVLSILYKKGLKFICSIDTDSL